MENDYRDAVALAHDRFDFVDLTPPAAGNDEYFAPPQAVLPPLGSAFPSAAARGLSRRALSRVSEFMTMNLGAHLTLNDLARAACVSRAHFARLFRISTGTSPMAYLLALRVEHAKGLLNGERQICEIAAELGFCDQSHFSRVFRRMTGITPKDFARRRAA